MTPDQRYKFIRRQIVKAVRRDRNGDLTPQDYAYVNQLAKEISSTWEIDVRHEREDAIRGFIHREEKNSK